MPPLPSTQVRTVGLALAIGTLAIALFVTQWPFDYRVTSFAIHARWNRIDWSWFPRTYAGTVVNRDFVLNLIMLMPLGVGFALWRRAPAMRLLVESLALGIATGATLELAQLLTRSRYTSFPDLWRNALGCLVGSLVVITIRQFRMRQL